MTSTKDNARHPLSAGTSFTRRTVLQATMSIPVLMSYRVFGNTYEYPNSTAEHPVKAFNLAAVTLLAGPFKTAQQVDSRYLLSLEPDRLLHNFRVNAGLAPKAPIYGGWESQEPWIDIRCHGHTLGHYLSACAMMAASTDEVVFKDRCNYMVDELAVCQQARGDGLVCAFPDGALQLENSLAGKPFIGVPWYTTHKVMAGLRDVYLYTESKQALQVLSRLADWIDGASSTLQPADFQHMLDTEHGGMNEVLADLYELTGNKTYLSLAERFCHQKLLQPMASSHDSLDGLHSNTQIPKVIGFERLHELTGEKRYADAASYFWKQVVEYRSFATGGNGDQEHFFPVSEFKQRLSSGKTMETCCTHNMLRLTRALFMKTSRINYADYFERALYNGILASQDPDSGMMTYFQSTRPGYLKLYCTPTNSFWCCTGTGMENHAKYGESIYFHDAESLYVNLFIASELNWTEKQLRVVQQTRFPDESSTQLTIHTRQPRKLNLKIRQPAWCQQAIVKINGKAIKQGTVPGSYIEIERRWRDGDTVSVELPMHLHLEKLPNSNEVAAVMYGPLVLAARLGTSGLTAGADQIVNERTYGAVLDMPMALPQLQLGESGITNKVTLKPGKVLAFSMKATQPQQELELIPFYRIAHERYNLYWQLA